MPKESAAAQGADADPRFAKLKVLVADDSQSIRALLVTILEQLGVGEIVEATDGNAALNLLKGRDEPIDILLSDLAMPGMDGVELLREVAQSNPGVAVLTISSLEARLRFAVSEMAQQLGLNVLGVLGKPFEPEDIKEALERFLTAKQPGAKLTQAPMTHAEIGLAIANRQVVVHYQPKVRVDNGRLVGVEALVRLMDPQRGLVPPDSFIDRSESGGQIVDLTHQVIDVALRQAGEWSRQGLRLNIGINIASAAIIRLDLPEHVNALAESHGLSPSQVTLEITESELRNPVELLDTCARFRMRGFGLAIDDYGTGESSLSRLRRMPFTELKIDKQYVDGAASNPELRAILSSSVDLGKKLGMVVVAEGVQQPADWELLEEVGCDIAQGYLVSRPLPAEKVMDWAVRWERLAADDR